MVNQENFNAWIHELRTTDKKQGKNMLKYVAEDGEARYCCIGVGCELAGLEEEYKSDSGTSFFDGYPTLAPPTFLQWLGLLAMMNEEVDFYPDWPIGLRGPNGSGLYNNSLSAAGLNDEGFTFAQIADVFAYFGLREIDE